MSAGCVTDGNLTICFGPRTEDIHRSEVSERWCFACRKRATFLYIVTAPIEPSYYGPSPRIECGNCGQIDGDCGFGRCREWEG